MTSSHRQPLQQQHTWSALTGRDQTDDMHCFTYQSQTLVPRSLAWSPSAPGCLGHHRACGTMPSRSGNLGFARSADTIPTSRLRKGAVASLPNQIATQATRDGSGGRRGTDPGGFFGGQPETGSWSLRSRPRATRCCCPPAEPAGPTFRWANRTRIRANHVLDHTPGVCPITELH